MLINTVLDVFRSGFRRVTASRVHGPVAAGILDDDVVVLVDAAHRACGGERLEHAVRPAAVTVLQRLDDLQVQVDVHQVSDLQAAGVPVPVLFTWSGRRVKCCQTRLKPDRSGGAGSFSITRSRYKLANHSGEIAGALGSMLPLIP